MMETITAQYLKEFSDLEQQYPGPIPFSVSFDFKRNSQKLFFVAATHGNEVGAIPSILQMIRDVASGQIKFGGKVIFALGNIEAIKINQRFVVEDMNRIYGKTNLTTPDAKRAHEMAQVISSVDLLLDFHQTIGPTLSSFYVIRASKENMYLAQALAGAPIGILSDDAEIKNQQQVTATAYAAKVGTSAVTVELSQKGYFPEAELKAYQMMKDTFHIYDHLAETTLEQAAQQKPSLKTIKVTYGHKFTSPKMQLKPGIKNLEFFTQGTQLGSIDGQAILAPFDGYILFPKYPERDSQGNARTPIPSDLFQMGQEVHV